MHQFRPTVILMTFCRSWWSGRSAKSARPNARSSAMRNGNGRQFANGLRYSGDTVDYGSLFQRTTGGGGRGGAVAEGEGGARAKGTRGISAGGKFDAIHSNPLVDIS